MNSNVSGPPPPPPPPPPPQCRLAGVSALDPPKNNEESPEGRAKPSPPPPPSIADSVFFIFLLHTECKYSRSFALTVCLTNQFAVSRHRLQNMQSTDKYPVVAPSGAAHSTSSVKKKRKKDVRLPRGCRAEWSCLNPLKGYCSYGEWSFRFFFFQPCVNRASGQILCCVFRRLYRLRHVFSFVFYIFSLGTRILGNGSETRSYN